MLHASAKQKQTVIMLINEKHDSILLGEALNPISSLFVG